jgi:hypothetical protein
MAKDSRPLVVSCPAMRNVMHCARMFSSGSRSPDFLSTPVSMRPSRSLLSAALPSERRSPMSLSTNSFMKASSAATRRRARTLSRDWIGSCRACACDAPRARIIAATKGCSVSR